MEETKKCTQCEIEKPLSEFHKNSYNKDGHQSSCKQCRNKAKKDWNQRNKEKISSYNKSRKMKN